MLIKLRICSYHSKKFLTSQSQYAAFMARVEGIRFGVLLWQHTKAIAGCSNDKEVLGTDKDCLGRITEDSDLSGETFS